MNDAQVAYSQEPYPMPLNTYRCDTCGAVLRIVTRPFAFACADYDCDGTMHPAEDTRVALDNRYRGEEVKDADLAG